MRFRFLVLHLAVAVLTLGPGLGALQAATPKPRPAKPATPPDPRVWSLAKGEDTFALRYALPRETDPSFAATCQPSANLLQIAVEVKTKKIASGDGVPLSLSNGRRRLELAATAFLGSSDGDLVVEAAVSLNARVFDLFRDGDTLVIKLPGETQSLPLAGARTRLADFERACLPKR
ncbi:hypothetical protein J5J86_02340 [Aquabacter sp. L1I39]|uniref:hypothetical protein n=1 Tax=Aquabacter sp. L1I39 TaxID=2820278 RepID=UPI001ADCB57F|nr:hypothetical protein [Aquabacter sp. L1I39]QTL04217.1 hypothetical protein J5J86_02340 [Aquabacter sp. L1I39]